MSISDTVRTQLPYLRRYARALTGSQDRGDAYVRALLEMLVASPNSMPDLGNERVSLYRMLGTIWSSADVNGRNPDPDTNWEAAAKEKLAALPPAARQAFLLVSLEGFTETEAATILEVDDGQFAMLLDTAARDIAMQVATDVLIIEDEPMIALEIQDLVTSLGHTVTNVARTHAEASTAYKEHKPGLVLADIQLADGSSGIDAVNEFLGASGDVPPIIFITAYPERLLTGERPEPTFLVTKPFAPAMVKALISQALFFEATSEIAA